MNAKDNNAWTRYDIESEKYFSNYKKLYFSDIHKQFIKFLPKDINSKLLDIGCGSGRDALSLARRGYEVTAVEPSERMLALAKEKSNHKNIRWVNDSLPSLLMLEKNTYDFVLISAVWMHIPPHKREESLKRISTLIKENGYLAITLRLGSPDPSRIMYELSVEDFLIQAARENLNPIYISKTMKDSFSRHEVTWKKITLRKEPQIYKTQN